MSSPGLDRPLRGAGRLPAVRRVPGQDGGRRGGRRPEALRRPPAGAGRRRRAAWRTARRRSGACPLGADRARAAGSGVLDGRQQQSGSADHRGARQGEGIEPEVVIAAIEDAVLTASRKVFKDGENLKARFNPETARSNCSPCRPSSRPSTNPATEISLDEAQSIYRELYGDEVADSVELGDEIEFPKPTEELGPHRRADRQAGHLPEGPRGRAREHLRRVQRAGRRGGQRDGQAVRERRHHHGDRPHRGGAAAQGAVARRELRARRPRPRRHQKASTRSAKGPQIVLSRTDPALLIKLFEQEVPEIYDGTVHDPRRRARGRRPRQGGRLLARARRRPGRRLRRHEGHARPGHHPRAARREDRHRRVVGGPGRRSSPTRSAPRRSSASRSSTTTRG